MSDSDILVHAMAAENQIKCTAAVTTGLVAEATRRHRTFPTASVALGRTLTGGLLLGAGLKDLEKITVQFHCEGPIGNIISQADAHGNVRGYVTNPQADATSLNEHGKFDVRSVVGGGTLYVTRDAGFEIGLLKEPYRGSVPIISGEIAEDLAYYLTKSEQINSGVSLGVLMSLESDGAERSIEGPVTEFDLDRLRVKAAGGFMIQLMPEADETLVSDLERALSRAPHATEMIRRGLGAAEILNEVLGDLELNILESIRPRFFCGCSRERALLIISALGRSEIEDMMKKDGGAELICHFCSTAYGISAAELEGLLDQPE